MNPFWTVTELERELREIASDRKHAQKQFKQDVRLAALYYKDALKDARADLRTELKSCDKCEAITRRDLKRAIAQRKKR